MQGIDALLMPLDRPIVEAFVPATEERIEEKENWVGLNDEWIVMVKLNTIWHLRNIYTMEGIPVESVENTDIISEGMWWGSYRYHYQMGEMHLLKVQIVDKPFKLGSVWQYNLVAVFDKLIAILRGGRGETWRVLRLDNLAPCKFVDALSDRWLTRIYAVTEPRGEVAVWEPQKWSKFMHI
jgi:hypothetical protein